MANRPYTWSEQETHRYDDIIHLPHPTSLRHPRMSPEARAAQFSPFAALVGYEDSISEAGRLTGSRTDVFDDDGIQLNAMLLQLAEACKQALPTRRSDGGAAFPTVSVTYFQPDARKEGGVYLTCTGPLKRVDAAQRLLVFQSGQTILLDDVIGIEEA